jgi:hypothetical protein
MRLWAARLISSERLKRARASSYVTSLTSMLIAFYTFTAAKIGIFSESAINSEIKL